MDKTSIEWTDATWNPVRGCTRVSPGCERCYAERVAARFSGPGQPYEGLAVMGSNGPRWTREVALIAGKLDQPLRWKKPRRIFVNSMSDLFHEGLSDMHIAAVFGVMAASPQHTFQILTKRAKRMRDWFDWVEASEESPYTTVLRETATWLHGDAWDRTLERTGLDRDLPECEEWPLRNVWLGVSAEDQQRADERIPFLLETPAAVRFVSYEPALGPVDMSRWVSRELMPHDMTGFATKAIFGPEFGNRLDWVIAGAESGPGARPMHEDWIRSVRDQCAASGTSFFYKQRIEDGFGSGTKKVTLPVLDGRQHVEFPR